jgi:PAS domain S-box-containing protein
MIGNSARRMNIYPTPEVAAQFVEELREKGSLQGWERELLKKSGEPFVAELSAQVLTVKGEKLILTTLFDVTARKRAEKALRDSENRFRAFFETAAVGTAELDLHGRFIQVNERYCQITGYSHQELMGMTAAELAHPEDRDSDLDQIMACLEGRLPVYDREKRYVRKDGRVIWVHVTAAMIRDAEGNLQCSAGVVEDITERKLAEEALRESESKFRALFQHSPDAVFLTIPDGRILAANPAACAMFGMSESDFIRPGRGIIDRDEARCIAALEKRQRTGLVTKTELTFIRGNGERFPGEVDSVILPGTPPKSFVIVRDITERKRAAEALLRTEKLASVGRMAATVAHEINNPLEGVTNALYLAKGTEGLPELAREYLEIADSELDRVAHIARQSLGFYRESNAPSAVDVNTVLESVLGLLRNRIEAKNATIKKHWEDHVHLTAVGGELRQVFSNLLTNSLDAIERNGTIILRVSTAVAHKNQRCVRVTISDNGKGVDANQRSQIFEPFFTTKGTVGTGLGLWISKQIVDNHSGTIRVRSTTDGPRKGTTISVLLPDTHPK